MEKRSRRNARFFRLKTFRNIGAVIFPTDIPIGCAVRPPVGVIA